jgi:hypothetical protein
MDGQFKVGDKVWITGLHQEITNNHGDRYNSIIGRSGVIERIDGSVRPYKVRIILAGLSPEDCLYTKMSAEGFLANMRPGELSLKKPRRRPKKASPGKARWKREFQRKEALCPRA